MTTPPALRHSVCRWPYAGIPLDDFCAAVRGMGISSVELLQPAEIAVARRHGLECAMVSFPTGATPDDTVVGRIEKAFNRLEHHDTLVEIYTPHLRAAAAAGADKVIVFSGNREGQDDAVSMENCATGLRRLLPLAEQLGLTLVMELLNSRIDHPDYQCDHTAWGIRLCEMLASPHFGLLYDIYHMRTMGEDVLADIRTHHRHFVHYHTGGVPGRHEIDASQELDYPEIVRAIRATGYTGYLGQEFIPTAADPLESLREAVRICS